MSRWDIDKTDSPSTLIDARISALPDWRGRVLARVRHLIKQADPEVIEEVKWRKPSNSMLGIPVWSHDGIICTGETYKDKVKLTFAKGASLDDPDGFFNSSLSGNTRRAIDIREGDEIDDRAFVSLVRSAVEVNVAARRKSRLFAVRSTRRAAQITQLTEEAAAESILWRPVCSDSFQ